ncbi:sortase domain-bontaining protein [Lacticaseibacillus hulanensis]|uniref:sortase domain-containing protein n=1 Tax=Lacticaseibacillus hulanensis TaxID=2493111 RepID=UPI0013E33BB8|nr:sortase [Lacticaseibacillus hulanensis]
MKIKYSRLVAGVVVAATAALLGKGAVSASANGTTDTVRTSQRGGANSSKAVSVQVHSIAKNMHKDSAADIKTAAKNTKKTPAATTKKAVASSTSSSATSKSSSSSVASATSTSSKSTAANTTSSSTSARSTSTSHATTVKRAATHTVAHRTATRPATVARNTISFAGARMTVIRGNMSVTTAPSGNVAQTWGGQTRLSVTDGQSTHIIGHNTSSFGRVLSLGVGSPVTVTDGNGNTRTYHVYSAKNVTDAGYISGTHTSVYNQIVSANQGEQVVLQTCISNTVNRIVWAR